MNFRRFLLVGLASTGLLAGCSAGNAQPEQIASSDDALDTRSGQQVFPWVSAETLAQKVAAFQARNGSSWASAPGNLDRRALPILTHMKRTDPEGAPKAFPADGDTQAVAFVRANADLFGLNAVDLGSIQIFWDFSPHHTITLRVDPRPRAGFQNVVVNDPLLLLDVSFGGDGVIREITREMPLPIPQDLTINPTPARPASDPLLHEHVIGSPLAFINDPWPRPVPAGQPTPTTPVEASDVGSAQVTLRAVERDDGLAVTLGYDFAITRNVCTDGRFGGVWHFFVDAETGELLSPPEPAHCTMEW